MRSIILAAAILAPAASSAAVMNYVANFIDLNPNDTTEVSGRADLSLDTAAGTLSVAIRARGLVPNGSAPGVLHVAHIHGPVDATGAPQNAVTPSLAANDSDGDGVLELIEGLPSYGPILLSLKDDTIPGAFDGFAEADANGFYAFDYTYDLATTPVFGADANGAAFSIDQLLPLHLREIVLHGGELLPGMAGLDSSASRPGPEEGNGVAGFKAFLPVAAAEITPAPVPLPAAGWLLLAGMGALAAVRPRRR